MKNKFQPPFRHRHDIEHDLRARKQANTMEIENGLKMGESSALFCVCESK
jgi:hypothetical protein